VKIKERFLFFIQKILSLVGVVKSAIDIRDIFVFGGLIAMGSGLWMIFPALSLIVCGLLLMLLGLGWLTRRIKS